MESAGSSVMSKEHVEILKAGDSFIKQSEEMRFSSKTHISEEEKKAEAVLMGLKKLLVSKTNNPTLHPFYSAKGVIESSELYKALHKMPKGGVLHLHYISCTKPDFVVKVISYEDNIWLDESEKVLKYSQTPLEGCRLLKDIRKEDPDFDGKLKEMMILTQEQISQPENKLIWNNFEHKFSLLYELFHYKEFFPKCLFETFVEFAEDNIFLVELRHRFGCLFDEDKKPVPIEEEYQMIMDTISRFKKEYPKYHYFEFRIISIGYKMLSNELLEETINNTIEICLKHPGLIVGYDLVNEEDEVKQLRELFGNISRIKKLEKENPAFKCPFILHSGESISRHNKNICDALALDAVRIGHGINIALYPSLLPYIKEHNISIEVNPISNRMLGFVPDLRQHPGRALMAAGVQITINSDAPLIWDYTGITLDFVHCFVAWELSMADLKTLAYNGIRCSQLTSEEKEKQLQIFDKHWNEFIDDLIK